MQEHPVPPSHFVVVASHSRPTYQLTRRINMAMEFTATRPVREDIAAVDKQPTYRMVRLDRFTMV